MTRTFIAFQLQAEVVEALRALQAEMKQQGLTFRWVHPGNIHLTLKFLGNTTDEQIKAVKGVIEDVAGSQAPLSLEARGLGVFPSLKKARVLWSGIHGDAARLGELHSNLERSLSAVGFEAERRAFRGHLTLGRVKGRIDKRTLAAAIAACGSFVSPAMTADRLILFKSELKPSGAEYTELFARKLGLPDAGVQP